jgi:hypothetical protein
MAYLKTNGIMNGQPAAQLGMVSWTAEKALVSSMQGKPYFVVSPRGYMKQTFSVSRFTGHTPTIIQFLVVALTRNRHTPGKLIIRVTLTYRDAFEETFTIPIMRTLFTERLLENYIETSDAEGRKLATVTIDVRNNDVVSLYLASLKMFPSEDNRDATTAPESEWDNFTDKAILYGLEADLPILR